MWRLRSCVLARSTIRMAPDLRGETLSVTLLLAGLLGGLCGCSSVSGASNPLPTRVATPRPVATPAVPPARPLVWIPALLPTGQLAPLPGGFVRSGPMVGVAQSDSALASACAPAPGPSNAGVATWLTHNRGATWQPTAGITVEIGSPIEVTDCQIVVDAVRASTAVAQVGFLPAGGCAPAVECINFALYVTTDLGQRWAPLQAPLNPQGPRSPYNTLETLGALATYQQVTYALFRSPPRSASTQSVAFVMSRDHLRTWTPVDGLGGVAIGDFWLNPVTGALLVMSTTGWYNQEAFQTSFDGGRTWTELAAPPFPFAVYDIAVQQPFTDQPWQICGGDPSSRIENGVQQNPHMDALACTSDGGAHWAIHQLAVANDRGSGANTGANYTLVGIADDGAALVTTPAGLARIVNGTAGAQALGLAPNAGLLIYAAGGGAGVLWSAPQGGYTDPDAQGRILTASYA